MGIFKFKRRSSSSKWLGRFSKPSSPQDSDSTRIDTQQRRSRRRSENATAIGICTPSSTELHLEEDDEAVILSPMMFYAGNHRSSRYSVSRTVSTTSTVSSQERMTATSSGDEEDISYRASTLYLDVGERGTRLEKSFSSYSLTSAPTSPISRRRIVRRARCFNCEGYYLLSMSKYPGYCSLDCKSASVLRDECTRRTSPTRCTSGSLIEDSLEFAV